MKDSVKRCLLVVFIVGTFALSDTAVEWVLAALSL